MLALLVGVAGIALAVKLGAGARHGAGLIGGVFVIGIYGGYFGAAAGVMLLALHAGRHATRRSRAATRSRTSCWRWRTWWRRSASACSGRCDWVAVAPLALGLFAGGRLGPIVVRRSNPGVLRTVIGALGLALAVKLGVDAYEPPTTASSTSMFPRVALE